MRWRSNRALCGLRRTRAVIERQVVSTMKPVVIIAIYLLAFVASCNRAPTFVGGSSGSYGNPDRESTTELVTQRDPHGQLLFVIAWTATHGGGSTRHSERNLLTQIHGRAVHPSLDQRAVYSLQTDGSLHQIPLTDKQINALFREMQEPSFHTSHSELWQNVIAPSLIRVEPTYGN